MCLSSRGRLFAHYGQFCSVYTMYDAIWASTRSEVWLRTFGFGPDGRRCVRNVPSSELWPSTSLECQSAYAHPFSYGAATPRRFRKTLGPFVSIRNVGGCRIHRPSEIPVFPGCLKNLVIPLIHRGRLPVYQRARLRCTPHHRTSQIPHISVLSLFPRPFV